MRRIEHKIPYELSGIATLLVDYLSRWGEEMEVFTALVATLIVGLLLDAQGLLSDPVVAVIFTLVVAAEFVFTLALAYRRRELEAALWRAVYELEEALAGTSDNNR